MTRRGVLTGAAVIAGATALPGFLLPQRSAIGHVVVDERLAESAAFAAGFASALHHPVNAIDDLCNLWYTRLRHLAKRESAHIAGLTTWMDFVVMRSCASEIGHVGAFHAEHVPDGTSLEHRVSAHPQLLQFLTGLAAPKNWARDMGSALASGAHLRSAFQPGKIFSARTAGALGHMRMVTWVFSPHSV